MTEPQENAQQGSPPPENAPPDLKQLKKQLASLQQSHEAGGAALERMGVQVDPASLYSIRLDTFIAFIFARMGSVSPEIRETLSVLYEIDYETAVIGSLKDVQGEIRKAMLGSAGGASKQDMMRMWQQEQRNGHGPAGAPPGFGGPGGQL